MVADITITTLSFVFAFITSFLIIWIISKLLKFKKQGFKYALIVATIAIILSMLTETINYLNSEIINIFFTLIAFIVGIAAIKYTYSEKWGKAMIAGIIWGFIAFIIETALIKYIEYAFA